MGLTESSSTFSGLYDTILLRDVPATIRWIKHACCCCFEQLKTPERWQLWNSSDHVQRAQSSVQPVLVCSLITQRDAQPQSAVLLQQSCGSAVNLSSRHCPSRCSCFHSVMFGQIEIFYVVKKNRNQRQAGHD